MSDEIREKFLQLVADTYDEAKLMGRDGDYINKVCNVTSEFTFKDLIVPTIKEIYSGLKKG